MKLYPILLKKFFFVALLIQAAMSLQLKALSIDTTTTSTMAWAKNLAFDIVNTHTLNSGEFLKGNIKLNNGLWLTGDATIGINQKLKGRIFLNSSELALDRDLYLGRHSTIHGPGTIRSHASIIGVSQYGKSRIHLSNPLYIKSGTVWFKDQMYMEGHGHKIYVDTTTNGKFGVGTTPYVGFFNVTLANVDTTTYDFTGSVITLDNTTFMVGTEIDFYGAHIYCRGDVKFYGQTGSVIKLRGTGFTLTDETNVYFSPGCHIETSDGWNRASWFDWDAKSSITYLDNCSMNFNQSSHTLTPWIIGTLIINGKVRLTTSAASYPITIGDGIPANDLNILYLQGSQLKLGNNIDLQIKNSN